MKHARLLSTLALAATTTVFAYELPAERIAHFEQPSIFQAWNPLDMPATFPLDTNENRLRAAAKHNVLWEEPVSQLGFKTPLVIGAVWDGPHAGLATHFTKDSLAQGLKNRARLLELNPRMIVLLEVRWRDAPGSYLPENSPYWKRIPDGTRKTGWDNGPEPYYWLDADNPEFAALIAKQCKIALESGLYDGIMLDWSGHMGVVQKTREVIGEDGIIIVNIHDHIDDGMKYQKYINGSFMECNPDGPGQPTTRNGTTWDKLRAGYVWFEQNLRQPRLNNLEVWGHRGDLRRMRATTTLALTHGDGSALYADPNPLKTPDHLHDWYSFWDVKLGRPLAPMTTLPNKLAVREFLGGTVAYNHHGNGNATITFASPRKRVSDGATGTEFTLQDADGDIYIVP